MTSVEINDKREQLKVEARSIVTKAKEEIRTLSEDEKTRMEAIKNELQSLNNELRNLADTVETPNTKENNDININTRMKKDFSLLTAIRNAANNVQQDEYTQAVINRGGEQMRHAGLSYVGQIQLPVELEERAVTVSTEHDDVVEVDMYDVLKPLRARNVLVKAGAKYIGNLVGDCQFPVLNSFSAQWENEVSTGTDTTPTFGSVTLSPKRLTVCVPISKQFILQDGVGAEQAIREEIINAVNGKLEATILGTSAGTTTQPAGIFYSASSLDEVADFEDLTELEAAAESANYYGEMKYIVSPSAKAKLRNMLKGHTTGTDGNISFGGAIYENGEIDGTPVLSTSHISNSKLAYGDWSNFVIAQWGNTDIVVDAYTLANQGLIRLVVNAYFDAKPLRSDAIQVATVA